MTAKEIIARLLACTGQFASVKFRSEIKPKAEFKGVHIEKVTTSVVRAGIQYKNLTVIKEAIENGERDEVGKLPWGEWLVYPYIIGHKGKEYVRLYPTDHIPKVSYFVNGRQVGKADVLQYLTDGVVAKMTDPNKERSECFSVWDGNFLDMED